MEAKRVRREKRQFTDEFRAGAVRLVLEEGKKVAQVARDLGLTPSSVSLWVRRARADRSGGKTGLTTDERGEYAAMRKELRVVKMERDIRLNSLWPSSRRRTHEVCVHPGGEGLVAGDDDMQRAPGLAARVLCVAGAPAVGAREGRRAVEGAHRRVVRREPRDLRQPARAQGSRHRARRPQPGHQADAGGGGSWLG